MDWSYRLKQAINYEEEDNENDCSDGDDDSKAIELNTDDDDLEVMLDHLIGLNATERWDNQRNARPWWKFQSIQRIHVLLL